MVSLNKTLCVVDNYDSKIGVFLISVIVFFTHAPFFIYLPVPGISMDTYGYYWFARQICEGSLPVTFMPIDFPVGYSFFLYLSKLMGFNIQNVVFLQTFIYLIASIFLIIQSSKTFKYGGFIVAFSLILYTISPLTIRYNTMLQTESLFTSSLMILVAFLIKYFRDFKFSSFAYVCLAVMVSILIRSNGLVFIIIPIFLIGFALIKKQKKRFVLFIPFAVVLLLNCSFNYALKGYFSIGDINRIKTVAKNFYKQNEEDKNSQNINYERVKRSTMYKHYLKNFFEQKPSFYFSLQKANYEKIIIKNRPKNYGETMFDCRYKVEEFSEGLTDFIFHGFNYEKQANKLHLTEMRSSDKNIWMLLNHYLYQILSKSKLFFLTYLMFWGAFFYLLSCLLKKGIENKVKTLSLCLIIISLIYITTLMILPLIHPRPQARFIHVAEFIIYIVALLGLYFFIKSRLNAKQKNHSSSSTCVQ